MIQLIQKVNIEEEEKRPKRKWKKSKERRIAENLIID